MIIQLNPGVRLHLIKTDKFKDITCSINFMSELNENSATERSVLALMLNDRTAKYDTKQKLTSALDHLYGATLSCRSIGYGKYHVIELRSKMINPCFVTESNHLFNDWFDLLREVIFRPLMNKDLLDERVYKESRDLLEDKLNRRNDDAQTYSILKAFEIAGKNQPLSVSSRGNLMSLKKQTCQDVTNQYHDMIHKNQIDIIICGSYDEQQMIKRIKNTFLFEPRELIRNVAYTLNPVTTSIESETRQTAQTNVTLVYSTGLKPTDTLYPALKVANGILGQYPTSYLFQVVREQHSLCYSIYSNIISYDGALAINTGIEEKDVDKALTLINEQIERCKKGDFDDQLIDITKTMLVNGLQISLDEPSSLIGYAYSNALLSREYTIENNIQDVLSVTKEQLITVFNMIKPAGGFVLYGKEEQDESNC